MLQARHDWLYSPSHSLSNPADSVHLASHASDAFLTMVSHASDAFLTNTYLGLQVSSSIIF